MAKIAIQPTNYPHGHGQCTDIEIVVHYALGDESADLEVLFYNGNIRLNTSPRVIPVPVQQMLAWNYNFDPIRAWVCDQIGAEILPQNPS